MDRLKPVFTRKKYLLFGLLLVIRKTSFTPKKKLADRRVSPDMLSPFSVSKKMNLKYIGKKKREESSFVDRFITQQ